MTYNDITLVLSLTFCLLLKAGFGIECGVRPDTVSAVRDLLVGLNSPLRLTIVSCYNTGKLCNKREDTNFS